MSNATGGASDSQAPPRIAVVRRLLFAVLALTMIGTLAELILLEHTEGIWQQLPLILLGAGILTLAAVILRRVALTIWLFRVAMLLCTLSGAVGVFLHYDGNSEFELEMYPSLDGMQLFWESMRGATPVLAPGTMTTIGLLGLIATCGLARK